MNSAWSWLNYTERFFGARSVNVKLYLSRNIRFEVCSNIFYRLWNLWIFIIFLNDNFIAINKKQSSKILKIHRFKILKLVILGLAKGFNTYHLFDHVREYSVPSDAVFQLLSIHSMKTAMWGNRVWVTQLIFWWTTFFFQFFFCKNKLTFELFLDVSLSSSSLLNVKITVSCVFCLARPLVKPVAFEGRPKLHRPLLFAAIVLVI